MGITYNVIDLWIEEDNLDYYDPVLILHKTVLSQCGIVNFLSENKSDQNQFSDWWISRQILMKRILEMIVPTTDRWRISYLLKFNEKLPIPYGHHQGVKERLASVRFRLL